MFSEYASRFLAQSQSRLIPRSDEESPKGHGRLLSRPGVSRFSSRAFLPKPTADPYQPATSQVTNFPFGSRNLPQNAPLFHSTTEDLREEDGESEREREIADFYALQRSRRHFGSSLLVDSSGIDEDEDDSTNLYGQPPLHKTYSKGKGIRGSWKFDHSTENVDGRQDSSNTRENLFDVRLEDSLRHEQNASEISDDDPPSVQRFREQSQSRIGPLGVDPTDIEENQREVNTAEFYQEGRLETLGYDVFWGYLFLISLACLFATSFLVYLHTSTPPRNGPGWGDTIYLTIHRSFYRLGVYTMVSIFVSLVWLALFRSCVRQLVYFVIFSVPAILYSFSLYPFVSSFKNPNGTSIQDKVMRCGSVFPFIMACLWIYNVIQGRRAVGRAIGILEFACRILAANIELLALGIGVLVAVVSWTWAWMFMFTRVFLGGHFGASNVFVVDLSSWWLAVCFVMIYLWSLGVIAGIQRAVTAATVSQWYFHRFAAPAPSSRQIVQAAFGYCLTTLFGTICLSQLIVLLIRLPFILLPSRIGSIVSLFAYSLSPTPITALMDPLAITYAAIHSQPLVISARGLTRMTNASPAATSRTAFASVLPYRLSKLILHAARLMMSLALGFGGWVTTARSSRVSSMTSGSGSMYAYVVGLIAGAIGWSVLGAVEGVIADIVDASVICWGSEVGTYGREARYCREAGWLFGEEVESDDRHVHFGEP